MVLTNEHITALYQDESQMAVPREIWAQIIVEVLDSVDDLKYFDDGILKQLVVNTKSLGWTNQDPNYGLQSSASISTPSFFIGSKL